MLEAALLHFRLVPPRAIGAAHVVFRRFQWYLRCSWRRAPDIKFLLQFLSIVKAEGIDSGFLMDTCGLLFLQRSTRIPIFRFADLNQRRSRPPARSRVSARLYSWKTSVVCRPLVGQFLIALSDHTRSMTRHTSADSESLAIWRANSPR
jgi:hypothetical protein